MRRLAVLALSVSLVAACSGDEAASDAASDDAGDDGSSAPASTVALTVPDAGDRCESVIDPADYLDAEIPTAVRPCETPEALVKQLVRPGTGRVAQPGDGVIFHATAIRADDGALVDSSWTAGRPIELPVVGRGGAATPGLDEGLVGVQAGELLRLDVPADLAYGDAPPGGDDAVVQPGDAVTYVIEVLAVVPLLVPEDAPLDLSVPASVDAVETTVDDLEVGDGRTVQEGDRVIIAMLLTRGDNLSVFFNSWDQRAPIAITLDPDLLDSPEPVTLPGIFEGLQGATVGSRRVITMPPSQAWGDGGQPTLGLPPDTDVVAVVDVLGAYEA